LVRKIGPDAFRPRPKVLSATVRLEPLPAPHNADPFFLSFVELAFAQKRKKLTNVLAPFYPKAKVLAALAAIGAGENARAEDLSVADFTAAFASLGPPPGVPAHKTSGGAALPSEAAVEDDLEDVTEGDDTESEEGEEEG
jgi:hypothetical protein